MSAALWMLASEFQHVAGMLDEVSDDAELTAKLDALGDDIERKCENIAHLIRFKEAASAASKEWATLALKAAAAEQAGADRLKAYVAGAMAATGIESIKRPGIVIGWRKSSAVVIEDATQIPAEYMRQKPAPEPEPDKKLIGDDIKLGVIVPGALVEQRKTLSIK